MAVMLAVARSCFATLLARMLMVDGAHPQQPAPWEKYILSPRQRTLRPLRIHSASPSAISMATARLHAAASSSIAWPILLDEPGSFVVLDFGKEVGGITTLSFTVANVSTSLGLAWSESTYYINSGDDSNGDNSRHDGHLSTGPLSHKPHGQTWTVPPASMRGGFRYLRIFIEETSMSSGGASAVMLNNVTVHFTPAPMYKDPGDYAGSFFTESDDEVNRVWYGAAYTAQMCTIDPAQGRAWPPPVLLWNNIATCGVGGSVIVDGAKRDRIIWPGDMGISSMVLHVTTGDTYSARMSLDTIYGSQNPSTGMLPYAGPPVNFDGNSDTYHLWALIGTLNTWDATANATFAMEHWNGFKKAVACSLSKIKDSPAPGLMFVDQRSDWQRCCQGKQNIAANSLLYGVLSRGSMMAAALNQTQQAGEWATASESLRASINSHLWDDKVGAYVDNTDAGNTLHPQDGNSLAVWFNVTRGPTAPPGRASRISDYLASNWGPFGSSSPEWDGNIGTFPGSMEVMAHATGANRPDRALAMARLQWGYMLSNPNSTQSTYWEGYNRDGSFNFGGAYMSNSHGWATGVAAALTLHVLGLRGVSPGAADYVLEPRPGDLRHCQGRLPVAGRVPTATAEASVFPATQYVDAEWAFDGNASFSATVDGRHHPSGIGSLILSSDILGFGSGVGTEAQSLSVRLYTSSSVSDGVLVFDGGKQVAPYREAEQPDHAGMSKSGRRYDVRLFYFDIPPARRAKFVVERATPLVV
eukprot:TRINITY_DN35962_c0_g1_i1.p1 TRINITY_DN35962_c0_g1~~TRINITY_DN35962_c0_g1_i1.p1  ORF type:complete len:755 (-),score=87.25 TRINITY_DN35962_c0_g1_i1:253-2517(-)